MPIDQFGAFTPCTQQRSDRAHTYTQPAQLTLLEYRFQPTLPLIGKDGPFVHCSNYPGGVNLNMISPMQAPVRDTRSILGGAMICAPPGSGSMPLI